MKENPISGECPGVDPKQFTNLLNAEYAKTILKETHASLFDAAHASGMSGDERLRPDLFISIEVMSPDEYKNGGESLSLNYSFAPTPFGDILMASTSKGICSCEFADDPAASLSALQRKFPKATLSLQSDSLQQNALRIFSPDRSRSQAIKLHLKGTDFQLKVWRALLKIPMGGMASYGDIASLTGNPRACRAVGTAVGDNPVALLIPCHRVIRASGEIGNYRWGVARKNAILAREAGK